MSISIVQKICHKEHRDAVKRAGIDGIPARSYLRASSGKGRQQRRHIRGF